MSDCDEGDTPLAGRFCQCGLAVPPEQRARARCPRCHLSWAPMSTALIERYPHDGGAKIVSWSDDDWKAMDASDELSDFSPRIARRTQEEAIDLLLREGPADRNPLRCADVSASEAVHEQILAHIRLGFGDCPDCDHSMGDHGADGCIIGWCACARSRGDLERLHGEVFGEDAEPEEDTVDHPAHYGGADNLYEAIKVIEAWGLGFCLGNTVKYIARAGRKDPAKLVEDLRKARWYLDREIQRLESDG